MRLTPVQLDRAAGALVGGAAGDALGAGYEFGPPAPPEPQMTGGGIADWEPGEWTDDTQMAICIAEDAASGALDVERVGGRWLSWYREGPKDVGIQTSGVLSSAATAADVAAASSAFFADHPRSSAGNGSLMRTGPVALAALGDPAQVAALAAALSAATHGDPLAAEACVLWSVGVDRAVRAGTFAGVREGLTHLAPGRAAWWAERLDEAERLPLSTFDPNGFVVPALQAAWAAITQTPVPAGQPCRHLGRALAAAVGVGHDTDTVAAIAGALLGARWGSSAIPLGWRSLLHGWPGYRSADLVRLGVLAARGGSGAPAGWPDAPTLIPEYVERYAPPGTVVPLAEDDGVVVGDVVGLRHLPEGIDVVVSLCRVGRMTSLPGSSTRSCGCSTSPTRRTTPTSTSSSPTPLRRWCGGGRRGGGSTCTASGRRAARPPSPLRTGRAVRPQWRRGAGAGEGSAAGEPAQPRVRCCARPTLVTGARGCRPVISA